MDIQNQAHMVCPICKKEMQAGGLIIEGIGSGWVPLEQFNRKGIKRLAYTGLRTIGITNILLGQTKVPNAFYCSNCNKVMGIFDVTNKIDA